MTLLEQGALARFSGPVALINPDGAVICANAAAAPIQAMLAQGTQHLASTVTGAIATGEDCTVTLFAPADGGGNLLLKLSILPLGKGKAALVIGHSTPLATPGIGAVASAHRYKDLLSLTGDFAWETNAAGLFTYVPEEGGFGWPAEAMLGRRAAEFLAGGRAGVDPFVARVPVSGITLAFRRADGGSTRTSVAAMPVLGHDSAWLGACGVAREDASGTSSLHMGEVVRLPGDTPAVSRLASR
jgi:hypothetical protein